MPFTFFYKHFKGDYSLGRSFWVNSLLVQLGISLLSILLFSWLGKNAEARYVSTAVLVLTVLWIFVWLWAVLGIWNSASKHVEKGGTQHWANAAKFVVLLGFFQMPMTLISQVPLLKEHWKVAAGFQPGEQVTFQTRVDGKSMLLSGGINDGTAEALSKELLRTPSVKTVVLQSSGGWVRQGDMIAKVIREHGLNTHVEQECNSACTIAFLAGKERTGEPNARLGFHSFKLVGADKSNINAAEISLVKATYRQAGLSESFIAKIIATPTDTIWYPTHEELLAEKIFTKISLGGEMTALATSITTHEDLSEMLLKEPLFVELKAKYPTEYNDLLDNAWSQVKSGKADGEILSSARMRIGLITMKLLPGVSDPALIDFNLLVAEQVEALDKINSEACVEYIFPSGRPVRVAAFFPQELITKETGMMINLIRTSNPQNAKHFTYEEKQQILQPLFARLSHEQVQIIGSGEVRQVTPSKDICQTFVTYLKILNGIPELQRATVLRALYSSS